MGKKLQLYWLFYKPLLKFNVIFSIWALYSLYANGFKVIGFTLVIKLIGYTLCVGYQYFTVNQSYYYFRNMGQPVRKLYAATFLCDFISYLFILSPYLITLTHAHP